MTKGRWDDDGDFMKLEEGEEYKVRILPPQRHWLSGQSAEVECGPACRICDLEAKRSGLKVVMMVDLADRAAGRVTTPRHVTITNQTMKQIKIGQDASLAPLHIGPRGAIAVNLADLSSTVLHSLHKLFVAGFVTVKDRFNPVYDDLNRMPDDTLAPPESAAEPRCECGLVSCGGPSQGHQHSRWCPVYTERT